LETICCGGEFLSFGLLLHLYDGNYKKKEERKEKKGKEEKKGKGRKGKEKIHPNYIILLVVVVGK
jgi:hypothetical protein